MKQIRESKVESRLKSEIEKIDGRYYKFVSPQNNGVPDRIVIYHGLVVFVETKRPNEAPRELQKFVIRDMRRNGALVAVVNTYDKVAAFIEWLLKTAPETVPAGPDEPQAGFYSL